MSTVLARHLYPGAQSLPVALHSDISDKLHKLSIEWLNAALMIYCTLHVKCIYINNHIKLIWLSPRLSALMRIVPFDWSTSCSVISFVVFNALQKLVLIFVILCMKLLETLPTKSCTVLWRSLKMFTLIWIVTEMVLVMLKIKITYNKNLYYKRVSKFKLNWNISLYNIIHKSILYNIH